MMRTEEQSKTDPILSPEKTWEVCKGAAVKGVPDVEKLFFSHESLRRMVLRLVEAQTPREHFSAREVAAVVVGADQ